MKQLEFEYSPSFQDLLFIPYVEAHPNQLSYVCSFSEKNSFLNSSENLQIRLATIRRTCLESNKYIWKDRSTASELSILEKCTINELFITYSPACDYNTSQNWIQLRALVTLSSARQLERTMHQQTCQYMFSVPYPHIPQWSSSPVPTKVPKEYSWSHCQDSFESSQRNTLNSRRSQYLAPEKTLEESALLLTLWRFESRSSNLKNA